MRIIASLLLFCVGTAFGQATFLEAGAGIGGSANSINLSLKKDWGLGSKKKFKVGTGLRFTSFFGSDRIFTSAPNALAIDLTKTDSLSAPKPSISSLNLLLNLGYEINKKIEVGFNIDLLGFSFGPEGSPTFISNGRSVSTTAKPTSVNLLLVGNNDIGSLNSHFYAKYKISEKFGLKLAYQYLFNELTTGTKVQTLPEPNDRFRLKSGMVFIGANYYF